MFQQTKWLLTLTSALLSIFSGHLIENTFNIIDYIVEKVGIKLAVENEARAIVKTILKRQNISTDEMVVDAHLCSAQHIQWSFNRKHF